MTKVFRSGLSVPGTSGSVSVNSAGTFTATSASITGSITFTAGTLGNWTVSTAGITSGSIGSGSATFNDLNLVASSSANAPLEYRPGNSA